MTAIIGAPEGHWRQLDPERLATTDVVNLRGWRAIDRAGRRAGVGRARRKIAPVDELLAAADPARGLSGLVRG